MIYYQTGVKTHDLKIAPPSRHTPTSPEIDFQTLLRCKPQRIDTNSLAEVENFKKEHLKYFIPGDFKRLVRRNENLTARSLLVLDFDQVADEQQFFTKVAETLKDIAFYAYPSISYGFKGPRWRLVVLINRTYGELDHEPLLRWAAQALGFVPDEKAKQWAQLMSLPVFNIYTDKSKRIYHKGMPLDIDEIIPAFKNVAADNHPRASNLGSGRVHEKKYTGRLLDMIVAGAAEGQRNDFITKLCGKMFRVGAEPETVYNMLMATNKEFIEPPLEDGEINTIFRSIYKRETRG